MAGWKSNYQRAKFLDYALGSVSYTPPATVYAALHSAALAVTDVANANEIAGTNYSRYAIPNNTSYWNDTVTTSTTGAVKTNKSIMNFGVAGATAWGVVSWASLVEGTVSTANIMYAGPLTIAKTIATDDGFALPVGGFSITEA